MINHIPVSVVNYIDYMMLKYPGIFPSPVRVLEHIFFVNGNGYKISKNTLCENSHPKMQPIETYIEKKVPTLLTDRKRVIVDCIAMSFGQHLQSSIHYHGKIYDNTLSEHVEKEFKSTMKDFAYIDKPVITEVDLDIDSLRSQLIEYNISVSDKLSRLSRMRGKDVEYSLPYPISKGYAICYEMNDKTPLWIVELCYNITFVYLEYLKTLPIEYTSDFGNVRDMVDNFTEVLNNCKVLLSIE